jgi:hypothetical protein
MSQHRRLRDAARDAVAALAGDTSVSRRKVKEALGEIIDECQARIDAVNEDVAEERDEEDA